MTPAERAQRIQAMREEIGATPCLTPAAVAYWCEWLECGWSEAMPTSVDSLRAWIGEMDRMAGDYARYSGLPEGWDPDADDDEGGAA